MNYKKKYLLLVRDIAKSKIVNLIGLFSFFILCMLLVIIIGIAKISHSSIGISETDKHFMELAYKEAALAIEHDDFPIGAILVVNGIVIAKAHNETLLNKDVRNHAEMLVISRALRSLKVSSFAQIKGDITLYTTYEPCAMCEGLIVYKSVPRIVVGKRKSFSEIIKNTYFGHIIYRLNERGGIYEDRQIELFHKMK